MSLSEVQVNDLARPLVGIITKFYADPKNEEDSASDFALVYYCGIAAYTDASLSFGVRPVFLLS